MKVKIKLKDTTTPIHYDNVLSHFVEGPCSNRVRQHLFVILDKI